MANVVDISQMEPTDVDTDFTLDEAHGIFAATRAAFPRLFKGRHTTIAPHPDPKYKPGLLKDLFNSLRTGYPLVGGYRAYGWRLNGRIARVMLTNHVWNVKDDKWVDTTPSESSTAKKTLLIEDTSGEVLRIAAEYMRVAFVLSNPTAARSIPTATLDNILLTYKTLGVFIQDDGGLNVTVEPGVDAARVSALLQTKREPSHVLYLGPGTVDKLMPKMRALDMLGGSRCSQHVISARDILKDKKCCWTCFKPGCTRKCSQCKVARYCSKECLEKDWYAGHKLDHAVLLKTE